MARVRLPITKCDDVDLGDVVAVTAAAATFAITAAGYYKIAAMGTPLLWKLGAVAVTATTGSYLAAGDQEVIWVPAPQDLNFIRSTDATADGEINIVVANFITTPGMDPREYL